jgi:hypothetical protein
LNGYTHEEYAKAVARLIVSHGFAPGAARFLQEDRSEFIEAASLPDRVDEVACAVPGHGRVTSLLGHGMSSFEHFQAFQRGYRWVDDPSLSLGVAAEVAAKVLAALVPIPGLGLVAGAVADLASTSSALAKVGGFRISVNDSGIRPPLVDFVRDTPMRLAVAQQPGWSLGTFCFPSAASVASFYALAAQRWALVGSPTGWRSCAGYAVHLVQDCCVPHHAWGALLMGHSEFENNLQDAWHQTFAEVLEANLFASTIARAVEIELARMTSCCLVADLCEANAAWSVAKFGEAHELAECPGNVALAVSIRAVASSVRACELMAAG